VIAPGLARALAAAGLLGLLVFTAAAAPVDEDAVRAIGADLRCVVCRACPSPTPVGDGNQMRGIIRERLAAGDSRNRSKPTS
jgi:cytochrome c-type biogenesis protein CcmH/NrfF